MDALPLAQQHCSGYRKDETAISTELVEELSAQIHSEWHVTDEGTAISRQFEFKNYYQTIAFVNAVAWIANREDHHPDMTVTYTQCQVTYTTHFVGGLRRNDFICAAKIDAL